MVIKKCERTKVLETPYKRLAIGLNFGNTLKIKAMPLMSVTWLKLCGEVVPLSIIN